jgi:hypothetical protein
MAIVFITIAVALMVTEFIYDRLINIGVLLKGSYGWGNKLDDWRIAVDVCLISPPRFDETDKGLLIGQNELYAPD